MKIQGQLLLYGKSFEPRCPHGWVTIWAAMHALAVAGGFSPGALYDSMGIVESASVHRFRRCCDLHYGLSPAKNRSIKR